MSIISLPIETFKPYGTGVKTSILILRKLEKKEKESRLESLKQCNNKKNDQHLNNRVFMGYINNIGYDNAGHLIEGSDVESLLLKYQEFRNGKDIGKEYGRNYVIPEYYIFNNRFDVKYHENFPIDTEKFKETCAFTEYCEVIDEKFNPSLNLQGYDIYYISIEELEPDAFYIDTPQLIPAEDIGSSKICKGGDIIVARLAPSFINKKSVIINQKIDKCYISGEFLVFRPKKKVTPEFILWLTKSNMFITQGLSKCSGATPSRYRLHDEFISEIIVPKYSENKIYEIGKRFFDGRMEIKQKINEINSTKMRVQPDF